MERLRFFIRIRKEYINMLVIWLRPLTSVGCYQLQCIFAMQWPLHKFQAQYREEKSFMQVRLMDLALGTWDTHLSKSIPLSQENVQGRPFRKRQDQLVGRQSSGKPGKGRDRRRTERKVQNRSQTAHLAARSPMKWCLKYYL